MQRQEKNEQQRRDTDDASKFVRFGGQRRQHVKNLAQSIHLCQRGPKLLGIIGHVLDAANSAGRSQGDIEPSHPSAGGRRGGESKP